MDDNSRRRLPLWMMGQNPQTEDTINNNNNDNNINESKNEDGNGKLIKARRPRSKANEKYSKRKLSGDEEAGESLSSSLLLVRCEERKKRRKRKLGVEGEDDYDDVVDDGNVNEIPMGKRKRGGKKRREGKANNSWIDSIEEEEIEGSLRKRGGRKRREFKANNSRINDNDMEEIEGSPETIDRDDADLTVEDLMSIAEEYVNEDKEVGQKRLSSKDDLTVEDLMSIAKEYVEEDTDVRGDRLLEDEHTADRKIQDVAVSGGSLCAGPYNSKKDIVDRQHLVNENVTSEETIAKPTMSGDPTQDMLNLFLGPLLKKPRDEEKKFNVITRDISFAYEVQKQKQSVASGEEAVPLTKKKSSLKDKVAMFLD